MSKNGLDSLCVQISQMKEKRIHASELSEQYSGPAQQVEFKATKDLVGHFGKIYGTKKSFFPIFAHKKMLFFFFFLLSNALVQWQPVTQKNILISKMWSNRKASRFGFSRWKAYPSLKFPFVLKEWSNMIFFVQENCYCSLQS